MDLLSLREAEVFRALKALQHNEFAVIGGYAVNAHTLPRFSIDCDIVVKNNGEAEKITQTLEKQGYAKAEDGKTPDAYGSKFVRLEKTLEKGFEVSFDVLVGEVFDRRTGASFSAEWVFKHSPKTRLRGKTVADSLMLRIVDANALVVMKLVASRKADLRDVFMLLPQVEDIEFVEKEVADKTNAGEAVKRAAETLLSKGFKNNLQGVFGRIDEKTFGKHVNSFKRLLG